MVHVTKPRVVGLFAALTAVAAPAPLLAQSRAEAKDMALVGTSDLQARSAYQPTIHKQGDRWIAYIGHHGGTKEVPKPRNALTGADEFNGTSLLDVTDPRHPKYLFHIPGDEGLAEDGGAQMVRVCDAAPCRRRITTPSTCCAPLATRRMRSGTRPIQPAQADHPARWA